MIYAIKRVGAGRCHTELQVHEAQADCAFVTGRGETTPICIDTRKIEILPENQRLAAILWAGGWDDYIVDMTDIQPLTDEEKEARKQSTGKGLNPLIRGGTYILGNFLHNLIGIDQCVKIVRHLVGGD